MFRYDDFSELITSVTDNEGFLFRGDVNEVLWSLLVVSRTIISNSDNDSCLQSEWLMAYRC